MVTERRHNKKLRERRTNGNPAFCCITKGDYISSQCDSSFSELIQSILQYFGGLALLVPAVVDGYGEHIQVGVVARMIVGFQELFGAHPGEAHQAEN